MSYFDAVSAGFRNYFDFQGRATRPEFWWFMLFLSLLGLGAGVADLTFGFSRPDSMMSGPISIIASLGTIVPAVSIGARRLHDIGRSGWWQLIGIVPFVGGLLVGSGLAVPLSILSLIGSILLIYWWCQPPAPNQGM